MNRRVVSHPHTPRLLFLCGANKEGSIPSERRQAISEFLKQRHPNVYVVLAESVYREFLSAGGRGNLFDLEKNLSEVSDHIVIVLEGYGSFCELGAFSHSPPIRSKLLIINDSKYGNDESFVNLGPLRAISEDSESRSVLSYPMDNEGVHFRDRIADVFPPINDVVSNAEREGRVRLSHAALLPAGQLTKEKALFLHDLIFLCGPVRYAGLIALIEDLFGERDYRLPKPALATLIALGLILKQNDGLYKTKATGTFYSYGGDELDLAISLRVHALRESLRSTK